MGTAKPHLKNKIEADTSKKLAQDKQVIKHTKPIVRRMIKPKKTTGFNKLYDI